MGWHSSELRAPGFAGFRSAGRWPVFLGLSSLVLEFLFQFEVASARGISRCALSFGRFDFEPGIGMETAKAISREAGIDLIISGHKHEQKVDLLVALWWFDFMWRNLFCKTLVRFVF